MSMSNRNQSTQPVDQKPARGRCVAAICFSWKVITCIVSHVTLVLLVVSYCVGGAYLFQHLEKPHEIEIKKGIQNMRLNLTDRIWQFSENSSYLSENDWVANVKKDLTNFEKQILTAMKTDGWDGDEDASKTQWTFAGSLFYSIIVITTIGYGHISPRTDWGKVTTIFYAIVGIPLMLLCLSNIGDVMATSFRFIYWRVCCYVCTRTARRPRKRSRQRSMRGHCYSSRSQQPTFRRSIKLSSRLSNNQSMGLPHAYSDPELRTMGRNDCDRDFGGRSNNRMTGRQNQYMTTQPSGHRGSHSGGRNHCEMSTYGNDCYNDGDRPNYIQTFNRTSRYSGHHRNRDIPRDRHTVERERYVGHSKHNFDSMDNLNMRDPQAKRTLSVRSVLSQNRIHRDELTRTSRDFRESRELNRLNSRGRSMPPNTRGGRAKSVDPRCASHSFFEDVNEDIVKKTPIISNRYAIDEMEHRHNKTPKATMRSQSMPRSAHVKNSYVYGHDSPTPYQNHLQQQHHQTQLSQPNRQHSFNRQNSRFGDRLELPEFSGSYINFNRKQRDRSPKVFQYEETEFRDYIDENEVFDDNCDDYNVHQFRQRERKPRRERAERLPPSPRIMSPMGFAVKRQVRRRTSCDYDDDSFYGEEWSDYYGDISPKDRPVPIWLCVFLVISYILGGAALFAYWEQWSFLDSAYFCFITLTTIGFGDFVPAKGVKDESEQSIAYCSLYLLFGIALLAMSFNLVQEEFIANVKEVAKRLGILKDDDDDD